MQGRVNSKAYQITHVRFPEGYGSADSPRPPHAADLPARTRSTAAPFLAAEGSSRCHGGTRQADFKITYGAAAAFAARASRANAPPGRAASSPRFSG